MQELKQYANEFIFKGKTYVVKVFSDYNMSYTVRVYLNDEPANGYFYGVDCNIRWGFDRKYGKDAAVNSLIETALEDVKNETWEKLIEIRKKRQ